VRELTNALPESIYTSSLSKGGFKLPPLLNVLVTTTLDAPPYTVQYKSVLLLPLSPRHAVGCPSRAITIR
jgi:hypothetical protein